MIDIAVPPDVQPAIIAEALKRSDRIRGILAQKPLACSYPEAKRLVDTCAAAGVRLVVNQNMRFDHAVRACADLLDRGTLGEPVLATIEMRAMEVIPPREQWQLGVEAVRELGRHAAGLGVRIAIELEPFRLSLVNSIDSMLAFLTAVGMPDTVRANCDISHLHLVHTPPADVSRLAGWIEHVHLSDCDGQVHGDLPPGRGVTPIADYLAAIKATGYDGTVSIELEYSPEPERIVEWVGEAYDQTAAIMRRLECRP